MIYSKSARAKLTKYVGIILNNASSPISQSEIKRKLIEEYGLNEIKDSKGNALYDAIQSVPNVYRFSEKAGVSKKSLENWMMKRLKLSVLL